MVLSPDGQDFIASVLSKASESFTVVYVLVDDYLKTGRQQGKFILPESPQRKAVTRNCRIWRFPSVSSELNAGLTP